MKYSKLLLTLALIISTFCFTVFQSCAGDDETPSGTEICDDAIDNDGDGYTDCQDDDCELSTSC